VKKKGFTKPAQKKADDFSLKTGAGLAVSSSLLCTASFPPFGLWPLAWTALIPALLAVSRARQKKSFFIGWLFGFFHILSMTYWVFNAFYFNSNAGLLVSLLFVGVLVCGLVGLYYALFFLCASRVMQKPLPAASKHIIVASLWVATEYCRSHLFSGIPWEMLGYSQYEQLRVIQVADITGVYGLSFCIVLTSSCLLGAFENRSDIRAALRQLLMPCALMAGVLLYGNVKLAAFSLPSPSAKPNEASSVAVVQGSILQNEKWKKGNYPDQLSLHLRLSEAALQRGARVIIWPETTIQDYLQEQIPQGLIELAGRYNASFIIGSPRYEGYEGNYTFYNAAFLVNSRGIAAFHDKMHLLPFGEYFPLGCLDFLRLRYAAPRQYTAGKKYSLLATEAGRAGTFLCYEILFPDLVRGFVGEGADIIVNISNDAWFGRTSAHYQHFSMAVFRAVEFRRPVIRAANTGISGFIAPTGRIVSHLNPFREGFLLHAPQIVTQHTFYSRYGDLFAVLCFSGIPFVFAPRVSAGNRAKKRGGGQC